MNVPDHEVDRVISLERRRNQQWAEDVMREALGLTAVEDEVERPDPRHRRRLEWAVGHSDLPATTRTLLRCILLHQPAAGGPCTAGYARLADESSLSESHVRDVLRKAARSGLITRNGSPGQRRIEVVLQCGADVLRALYQLWSAGKPDLDPGGSDEEVNRFTWIREVVADARLAAREKGAAFAIDLLTTSGGQPFRRTTVDDLASLSGYARQATHQSIDGLEEAGWISSIRKRGPGGGLLIWLALPEEIAQRIELQDALRHGEDVLEPHVGAGELLGDVERLGEEPKGWLALLRTRAAWARLQVSNEDLRDFSTKLELVGPVHEREARQVQEDVVALLLRPVRSTRAGRTMSTVPHLRTALEKIPNEPEAVRKIAEAVRVWRRITEKELTEEPRYRTDRVVETMLSIPALEPYIKRLTAQEMPHLAQMFHPNTLERAKTDTALRGLFCYSLSSDYTPALEEVEVVTE